MILPVITLPSAQKLFPNICHDSPRPPFFFFFQGRLSKHRARGQLTGWTFTGADSAWVGSS